MRQVTSDTLKAILKAFNDALSRRALIPLTMVLRPLGATGAAALAFVLLSSAGQAQAASAVLGCYRFDRSYFVWVGPMQKGHQVEVDSSSVVRLDPATKPGGDQLRAGGGMQPLPFSSDPSTRHRWLDRSGWNAIGIDSISMWWHNGLYGPVFRMAVLGDSLRGLTWYKSDMAGFGELPPKPAMAVRIPCESGKDNR